MKLKKNFSTYSGSAFLNHLNQIKFCPTYSRADSDILAANAEQTGVRSKQIFFDITAETELSNSQISYYNAPYACGLLILKLEPLVQCA